MFEVDDSPEKVPKPHKRRVLIEAGIGAIVFAVVVAAGLYLRGDAFQNRIRNKVVGELERITGGRVELKSFTWNLSKLEFEGHDLTIHGLEPAGEAPYAQADRLAVRLKILNLFDRDIGLRYFIAERPRIHIMVFPDGTTSQPVPKVKTQSSMTPADQIFALAIDRVEITDGELLWNDKRLPLDLVGNNVAAGMKYLAGKDPSYDGSINIGSMMTRYQQLQPLKSSLEVRFALRRDAAEIKALKWASALSSFEGSGRLTDYFNPKLELKYNASLNLPEMAAFVALPEVRRGQVVLNGEGSYSAKEFATTGKIFLKDGEYMSAGLRVSGVHAASPYSITRETISLPQISGRALGGAITGQASVRNYLSAPSGTPRQGSGAPPGIQAGAAHLKLSGVQMPAVAGAISSKSMPLDKLNASGVAHGTVDVAWKGSPANADAAFDLVVEPNASPAAGQVPLTASARGIYHATSSMLELSKLDLTTPASHLSATGALGSNSSGLQVELRSNDLKELEPLLVAFKPGAKMPLELRGPGSFKGTISGKMSAPTIKGHVEVAGFDTAMPSGNASASPLAGIAQVGQPVTKPAVDRHPGPDTPGSKVHWDALSADIEYSPSGFTARNATLRKGKTVITLSGTTSLGKGGFGDNSVIDTKIAIRDGSVAELQSLLGTNYPITGHLNADIQVSGTAGDPRGAGNFTITDAVAYGEPFKSIRSDIRFANHEAQLTNLTASHAAGDIAGNAGYNLVAKTFHFDLRANNLDLAKVRQLQTSSMTMRATGQFTANGSGTLEAPVINATAAIKNLVLNGEQVGDVTAEATTHGSELQLKARSSFQSAVLSLDGSVTLRGDFPGQVKLQVSQFDVDPLVKAFLPGRVTGHSSVAGNIELRGPFKQPRSLTAALELTQFEATLENVKLANDGPIRVELANQVVTVKQLRLLGENTNMSLAGTVDLKGDRPIDLRADGDINLKLLQGLDPDLVTSGGTKLAVTVHGNVKSPMVNGEVTITNAAISFIDLPNGLSDINGRLVFNENRLQVQSLVAHTGGGELKLGGFIAYRNGLFFNLTANGKDIRSRYPEGISTMADLDLRLAGSSNNSLLSGDVLVTKFGMNPRFDFSLYIARAHQPPVTPKPNTVQDNMRLEVHVTSTPELRVETSLAKLSGDVDLHIRGTASRPAVLGRVNVEDGDVFFNSTKYHIERGDVLFSNPVRIEPILNVEASARVREYDITLGFHGSTDKLATTYRSDPPLPTADIIALLALGRTREESVNSALNPSANQSFSETASNAILGEAVNAAISSRVQKLFGVSKIKIDPQVGGPENNPNARLTIEQQVSNNITLTYITNLTSSSQQIIQVEFNVNKNVSIVAVRDQNGVVGFDVRVRRRRR